MKANIIIKNEVQCNVENLQPNHLEYFIKKYTKYVPGFKFMPSYVLGTWDGKISFFNKKGETYVNYLYEILSDLINFGYDYHIEDYRRNYNFPKIVIDKDVLKKYNELITLQDHQVNAVNAIFSNDINPKGIINACTGAGKTFICATISLIMKDLGYKTIIVVPSSDLVDQTIETFDLLKQKVGQYSGSRKTLEESIVIATWQALQHHPTIIQEFDCFIIDECHQFKCNTLVKLANEYGKNIPFRIGCTGTIPKDEIDVLSLQSGLSNIVINITAKELIEKGLLSTININMIELDDMTRLGVNLPEYKQEKKWFSTYEPRLEEISNKIISIKNKHGNTLVLVSNIETGIKLNELIPNSIFLYGQSKKKERKENYDAFDENDGMIVIATSGIASTGLSIDRIFSLIFVDYHKSMIKTIQSVGRGLRKGKDKNHIEVYDIYSNLKFAIEHAKERKKEYKRAGYPFNTKKLKY